MTYTLQNFIASVKSDGLARANLFGVIITLPAKLSQYSNFMNNTAAMYANKANIPGTDVSTTGIQNFGEKIYRPSVRSFKQGFSITFYVDSQYKIKTMFEDWIDIIIDPITKTQNYMDDFVGMISVLGNNRAGSAVYSMNVFDAYPTSVSDIPLSYEVNGTTIVGLDVQFSYRNFTQDKTYPMPQDVLGAMQSANNLVGNNLPMPLPSVPSQFSSFNLP